jgi:hypothetical protein
MPSGPASDPYIPAHKPSNRSADFVSIVAYTCP